jgi:hypothetical protein
MAQADSKNSITAPPAMASWFQGTIGDRRDILEGDDFRNRLVARVETPELADQIAEHNAAAKAALPAIPSRRLFLSQAAGLAAGGTALALATVTPTPAAADDSALLKLEERIFEKKEAFDRLKPEVDRLNAIYTAEEWRMHGEFEATRTGPTFAERRAIIDSMPAFKEYMRLRGLQEREREAADRLVEQMWEIKAQTPEGRRSKLIVLLGYVMEGDEWRDAKRPGVTFDVTLARDLMIELVGGEPGAQLRDQFA